MKIKLKCVSAVLVASPKPEDVVVRYGFHSGNPPQGKDGDAWQDGQFQAWDKTPDKYAVGKEYELSGDIQ